MPPANAAPGNVTIHEPAAPLVAIVSATGYIRCIGGKHLHRHSPAMTTFTLERPETQQLPAARCTFEQTVSKSGKTWFEVTMRELYSTGWAHTMGKGSGTYSVNHAREFYASLLQRGYTAA